MIQQNNSNNQQFSDYAAQSAQEVCESFNTSIEHGLSSEQVGQLQKQYGFNEILGHEVTAWQILFNQLKSPFIYLLVIIAGVDFMLRDIPDGVMILIIVIINTHFGFYQEFRTHHALQFLKKYLVDKIRVTRDGKEVEITTRELVPGDSIKLYPGDKIPADVRIVISENISVDESTLTGESEPVKKTSEPTADKVTNVFEANNIGFSGTVVASGMARAVVFATGNHTYFGSIATHAQETPKLTSFMQGITRFSRFILYTVFITISAVFALHLLFGTHIDIINLVIFSLALGISIIPEALPVVIMLSLARGAVNLAKHKVIVKRLSAIEDLGSMSLLCIDKTGTITENKLSLAAIHAADEHQALTYALLASGLSSEQLQKDQGFNGVLWQKLTPQEQELVKNYKVVAEHPFDAHVWYSSIVVQQGDSHELIVRGNKEEVFKLCNLDTKKEQELYAWADQEARQGHRVLVVAKKNVPATLTKMSEDDEKDLEYIGLISYDDPLKPTAEASLARARALGVKVKIISGDTKEVNFAIAQKIKLVTQQDEIITGEEFAKKSDAEKQKLVEYCSVFAHILPDQKVEIIKLLEQNYDVGYVGDGINDAPALKIADVSIAVDTAADSARDMADIILLHKSLRVIVDGIHEGRVVFANLMKYIKSTLAANFGHFYSLSIISLFIDFLPILPSQLLLVSLLTDLPLIAISTDTVSLQDINAPKKYDLKNIIVIAALLGLLVMVADFIIFKLFYHVNDHAVLQTNWFIMSILVEVSFFYSIRTTLPFYKAPMPSLQVMALSCFVVITALVLPFTRFGQEFLHFKTPALADLFSIFLVVISYFVITDIVKVLFYRYSRSAERSSSNSNSSSRVR